VIVKETRGKPALYVMCLIREKEVLLKQEELVRQLWLNRLLSGLGYPKRRIAVEYPITFGRDTSKRADIVVFDADRLTVPYIIVEVKQAKYKDGKEQLRSYSHATGAPLALWSNGSLAEVWHRKKSKLFHANSRTAPRRSDDRAGGGSALDGPKADRAGRGADQGRQKRSIAS
jgi:type I restriction enzyme M protein